MDELNFDGLTGRIDSISEMKFLIVTYLISNSILAWNKAQIFTTL